MENALDTTDWRLKPSCEHICADWFLFVIWFNCEAMDEENRSQVTESELVSLRNNRVNFKTWGKLQIMLEESCRQIMYAALMKRIRNITTCRILTDCACCQGSHQILQITRLLMSHCLQASSFAIHQQVNLNENATLVSPYRGMPWECFVQCKGDWARACALKCHSARPHGAFPYTKIVHSGHYAIHDAM